MQICEICIGQIEEGPAGRRLGSNEGRQGILHKCRNCNRTDKRQYNPRAEEHCNHCNPPMDPLEIRYKCVNCGHMSWAEADSTGRSCHKCGYRILSSHEKMAWPRF
ncbi:MAG: hypothetical protein Ct9H90mP1_0560 [Methanobacteriota archaeon]|nr:MAG: hypothetical protein Ct9H90mP1_0560 [Euryarchaeota archaeon]